MEYTSSALAGYENTAGRDTARPCDLTVLRMQVEDMLERARGIAIRTESIGDLVFGSIPTSIGSAGKPAGPPAAFVEVVSDLDSTLNRINSALNRL